jgi:hypothetical protein
MGQGKGGYSQGYPQLNRLFHLGFINNQLMGRRHNPSLLLM